MFLDGPTVIHTSEVDTSPTSEDHTQCRLSSSALISGGEREEMDDSEVNFAAEIKIERTSSSCKNRGKSESSMAEKSHQVRYVKLDERLGSGTSKHVWTAFDTAEGMQVAWNVVELKNITPDERKRVAIEVMLLRNLDHKNVIKYYNSWIDREKEQVVFITEIMSAGSLKDYLRKHHHMIRWHAVKRWCKQILFGLEYLHERRCIHRDIKTENIFINGTTGDIRIGDLGLSTKVAEARGAIQGGMNFEGRENISQVMTCLGTPEFMAPELYEENYDEKVDIYAFGMTVLEMVTASTPYHDCKASAHLQPQIYMKVMRGELPPELNRVSISSARGFIELCLTSKEGRPSATELLKHPFLSANVEEDFKEVIHWNNLRSYDNQKNPGGVIGGSGGDVDDDDDDDDELIYEDIMDAVDDEVEVEMEDISMKRCAHGINITNISSACSNNTPFSDIGPALSYSTGSDILAM